MALSTVTTGNTILAADVNQLVNVLQRASGQSETGKYFIASQLYANGVVCSQYLQSLSRVSTPVSVTIDTADQASAGGFSTMNTAQLTANGFQCFSFAGNTGPNTNGRAGGNTTIQF